MDVKELHKQFCTEEFDEYGVISKFEIHCPDHFNFAYDVVDVIAAEEPNRRAMTWCNEAGDERVFSFGDMKKYSDKTANMLVKHGIKKGDKVLLILKRHYEFWFTILALHKIGAIAVPATNLLTTKDIVYRIKSATITAAVCTAGTPSDALMKRRNNVMNCKQKSLSTVRKKTGLILLPKWMRLPNSLSGSSPTKPIGCSFILLPVPPDIRKW